MNIKLNIKPFLLLVVFIGVGNMTVFGQDYIETENLEAVIIYGSSGYMTYAEYNNWVSNLGTGGNYNDYDTNTDLYYFYDYNSGSGSSTNTTDSSSNSVSNLEIPAEFKNGNLGLKNPNITIPCKRETVAGVNTLVLAPIKQLVVNMPTAELNGMISLYNSTATNPVTVEGVVSGITSNLEAGTIVITSIGEFEVWLQQYVITRAVELSGNDDVRFEGCDGSCYCDACEKQWYLDNDGDGYHVSTQLSITKPANGKWKSSTLGEDCDDNNIKVYDAGPTSLPNRIIFESQTVPGKEANGVDDARDYLSGDLNQEKVFQEIENLDGFWDRWRSKNKYEDIIQLTNDELFAEMENAAHLTLEYQLTFGQGLGDFSFFENYSANLEMINRFRQNLRGINEITGITRTIMLNDAGFQNYLTDTSNTVITAISDINSIDELSQLSVSGISSPTFGVGANRFNWNGSWSFKLQLINLTVNCDKVTCNLVLDVYDQFGLDTMDMFTSSFSAKARKLDGFWAWFHLQRVIGINPFINHFNISTNINTTIN